MARANVKLYLNGTVVAESAINTVDPEGNAVDVSDALLDSWAEQFRSSKLTLASLKVDQWDVIEFDVDGTIHTRNF
jgi:hypothetical protein